jgi:chemotaxis protein CheD
MQAGCEGRSSGPKLIAVGIGKVVVSSDPNAVLVAHALGSCVALIAYHPLRRVGGMLHYLLPSSALSHEDVRERPGLFADTGIRLLLKKLAARECQSAGLVLKAAGGSSLFDDDEIGVGQRNMVALLESLARRKLELTSNALGGTDSRTVRLHVGSGTVRVRTASDRNEVDL